MPLGILRASPAESADSLTCGVWMVTKLLRAWIGTALLLAGSCAGIGMARGQDLAPAGSGSPGIQELPPPASEPPDLLSKYKNDPLMLRALREQARQRGEARQKQLLDATNLLLKIAKELREQIASHPGAVPDHTETARLEQIQKLAHAIQDREKTEDDVSSDLAKAGMWP